MKLKLSGETLSKLRPTGKRDLEGNVLVPAKRRTYVPLIQDSVAEDQVVDVQDEAVAKALTAGGLMVLADAETKKSKKRPAPAEEEI